MYATIRLAIVALLVLAACSDDDGGPAAPATRGIAGLWDLYIESEDGADKFPYALGAVASESGDEVSFQFNTSALQDSATEIWSGNIEANRTVQFKVTFINHESGEVIVSPYLAPKGTFAADYASFRTETWERRDEANNVLGYYFYSGYKRE